LKKASVWAELWKGARVDVEGLARVDIFFRVQFVECMVKL
jgi:hypothetical protein